MNTESIMPISTQKIILEQFNELNNITTEPAKQLNQLFFNMMLKSVFDTSVTGNKSTTTPLLQLNQQLYLNTLTQQLSDNFNIGFSKLQFETGQQEYK